MTDFNFIMLHFLDCIRIKLFHEHGSLPESSGYGSGVGSSSIGGNFNSDRDSMETIVQIMSSYQRSDQGVSVDDIAGSINLPVDKVEFLCQHLLNENRIEYGFDERHFKIVM